MKFYRRGYGPLEIVICAIGGVLLLKDNVVKHAYNILFPPEMFYYYYKDALKDPGGELKKAARISLLSKYGKKQFEHDLMAVVLFGLGFATFWTGLMWTLDTLPNRREIVLWAISALKWVGIAALFTRTCYELGSFVGKVQARRRQGFRNY